MADFDMELPPQGEMECMECGIITDDLMWDYEEGNWSDPVCFGCYQDKRDDEYDEDYMTMYCMYRPEDDCA